MSISNFDQRVRKIAAGFRAFCAINIKNDPGNVFPAQLFIKLTDRCNHRCITCNHYNIGNTEGELTLHQLQNIIKDFEQMGGLSVHFTGGEPFLRKEIFPLISYAKSLRLRVGIVTNGSLLSENHISILKKKAVDHINISLHGRKDTHDSIVGIKGNWEKLDRVIKQLKNAGLRVHIAFTIIKKNLNEIEYIVQYAKELDIAVGFNIFDTNVYFFKDVDKTIAPDIVEMTDCSKLLLDLKRRYPHHINESLKAIRVIPNLFRDSRLPYYFCVRTILELCVDSCGNVYAGCWAMPSVGNLKDHTLIDIFNSNEYRETRLEGFVKKCPGCTCRYQLDVLMNIKSRNTY